MALLPMVVGACAAQSPRAMRRFLFLSTVGCYSLFPLLFRAQEYCIKIVALALYTLVAAAWLSRDHGWGAAALPTRWERAYLAGIAPLEVAATWALPPLLHDRLPFLPLAAVSCYTALGVLATWARMARDQWALARAPAPGASSDDKLRPAPTAACM